MIDDVRNNIPCYVMNDRVTWFIFACCLVLCFPVTWWFLHTDHVKNHKLVHTSTLLVSSPSSFSRSLFFLAAMVGSGTWGPPERGWGEGGKLYEYQYFDIRISIFCTLFQPYLGCMAPLSSLTAKCDWRMVKVFNFEEERKHASRARTHTQEHAPMSLA